MWDESAKNLVKKILLSYKTILIGSHSEVEPILDELICDINTVLAELKDVLPYNTNLSFSFEEAKKELIMVFEDLREETKKNR